MKVINTLKTPHLLKKRRSGNTTRQINFAIDKLFQGYKVKVIDHSTLRIQSQSLFDSIVHRLEIEHNLEELIVSESIIINHKNLTLELC